MAQGNLRNRKQQQVKETSSSPTVTEEHEEVVSPRRHEQEQEDEGDDHAYFRLTPLIQRSVWMRLDVGPFLLAYAGLITFDSLESISDFTLLGFAWTTIAFAATLLLHLATVLWTQWSIPMRADVGYSFSSSSTTTDSVAKQWTHCLVQTAHKEMDGSTVAGIVPVIHESKQVVTVTFQDRVFRCCLNPPDVDVTLWSCGEKKPAATTTQQPRFRPVQYPIHLPLQWYASVWLGHTSLPSCTAANQVYGRNSTALKLPAFIELLAEQTVAPFFLFQVFCVVLWSLDEYWYYALFTLFALILFESTVAYNRLKSLQRLHAISHRNQYQRVWVRRGMDASHVAWMSIPVAELVPGDWTSLSGSHVHVPADILLLHGTAVCDEALLTGESVPQLKQPLDSNAATATTSLVMQDVEHKESILFGGTVLLVGTPLDGSPEQLPPDKGITGIVLRTGFETAQGNLLRTMAHTSKSSVGVHTADTFVFILILIFCAIGAAAYVLNEGWYDERRNRFRLMLHVVIIITSVIPPELPMELSLAVTNSVADLMKRSQVYCTEHFRIPWAGEVNVCCFDKTGTLTSDEMLLKGVRLFDEKLLAESDANEDSALVHPTEGDLPWETVRIMAACHSLAVAAMGRGNDKTPRLEVIGDPLEQAVMKDTGYRLLGNNVVAANDENSAGQWHKPISILHRFAFSSKLKRMTVLVTEEGGKGTIWALTKGAPETIKELLLKESIPFNYDDVSFHHMSRGRRVLAMAYREVGAIRNLQLLKDGGRDSVEQNLTFVGFMVLDCPLKPDSKSVISELKKSGHTVVMITGDAILTAAEVARQVGIIRRSSSGKRTVYRIEKRIDGGATNPSDPLSFFECAPLGSSAEGRATLELSRTKFEKLLRMSKEGEASFCISGDTLVNLASTAVQVDRSSALSTQSSSLDEKHLLMSPAAQSVLSKLVPIVSVFARHAPHQKEAVVAAFNHGGFQTLMCGDGTNDVGALKRAHVGISIISAPEVESKQREARAKISQAKANDKLERKSKSKSKRASRATTLEESLRQLREAQDELDQVELGDASVAAPFTSRAVSIKCCKDVIQQGRCTLVTMLQIYKILGINCLVNALVLSKLFLHGVKQGDRQLTILGVVVTLLFFFVTRAEPLSVLSPIRPPASVLCVQALVSISGQFLICLATILLATEAALFFVDPYDPSLVPDGPFNPNVLNTCTFLLTCLSTINTFAVNYRGRPFMKDLRENKLFYRSLQVCYAVLAICALEVFPPLNDLLQLTALPSVNTLEESVSNPIIDLIRTVDFPVFMSLLMALNIILSFSFERTVLHAFERR